MDLLHGVSTGCMALDKAQNDGFESHSSGGVRAQTIRCKRYHNNGFLANLASIWKVARLDDAQLYRV